jgi:transposase-like protein
MNKSPRVHTPAFKAQVALAALKGDRTLSEIAAQHWSACIPGRDAQ